MAKSYLNLQFLGVGHSYVKGTISGLGVADNSYRREMYYRARSKYGMNWTFVGSFTGGDIPTPHHNGVAGEDSDGLNTLIDGYLDNAFPIPSSDDCILLGPIGFADCLNEIPLATFNSNLDSIISKINLHSSLINIFVVVDPWCPYGSFPSGQDIDDYAAEVRTVYADALAAGHNVRLLDLNTPNTETINIGPDDIHPDYYGYQQMGELFTDTIIEALNVGEGTAPVVLQDTFTDTNGVLIKNHTPDVNITGDVWHDANDRFEINENAAKGIGGYAYDTQLDLGQVAWKGQIKLYQSSALTQPFFVLKINSAGTIFLRLFMDHTNSLLYIYSQGGVWDSASFANSLNTWYTFNINVRGNSIEISDENDVLILRVPLLTYGNYTRIGLAYWPSGVHVSKIDDLLIHGQQAVPASADTDITNMQCMKSSTLQITTSVELQLNLGESLDAATDITKDVINLSDVKEKLTKSSVSTGGVILPNMKIKLDNSRGKFSKLGDMFRAGFVNNSIIRITTNYVDSDGADIADQFIYKGLIKYASCKWDRIDHIFEATIIPASSLLATEKIAAGILSHTTFKNTCYKMLNRSPFTKYMSIELDNLNMGWDVASINYGDMTNKKVKTVLDEIMLLTGSVYYVNYDQEFIIEPAIPTVPVSVCAFRGDDIYSVNSEEYDWKAHYTGVTWDDSENTVKRVEMDFPDRELYQYDFSELMLKNKYVTDATARNDILDSLLEMYKFLKRKVKIVCKWNPEVLVNKYITLDIAEEVIDGDKFMIWNKDHWNDGKYWGIKSPGISFSSNNLWRVVDIKRDTEGKKMQLTLVQLYSDDEI